MTLGKGDLVGVFLFGLVLGVGAMWSGLLFTDTYQVGYSNGACLHDSHANATHECSYWHSEPHCDDAYYAEKANTTDPFFPLNHACIEAQP